MNLYGKKVKFRRLVLLLEFFVNTISNFYYFLILYACIFNVNFTFLNCIAVFL